MLILSLKQTTMATDTRTYQNKTSYRNVRQLGLFFDTFKIFFLEISNLSALSLG